MPPWLKMLIFTTALLLPSATSAQQPIASEITNAIHQLSDRDPRVRRNAAEFLGNQASNTPAPDERQAVPPLVAALKDPDSDVRFAAAFALGNIGSDGKAVIPALVASLDDVSDRVLEEAMPWRGRARSAVVLDESCQGSCQRGTVRWNQSFVANASLRAAHQRSSQDGLWCKRFAPVRYSGLWRGEDQQ